jgi:hypothetical protein
LVENIPDEKLSTQCFLSADPPVSLGFVIEDYVMHMRITSISFYAAIRSRNIPARRGDAARNPQIHRLQFAGHTQKSNVSFPLESS